MAKDKRPATLSKAKGGGLVMGLIVPALVLTAVAGAGGWVLGGQIAAAKNASSAESKPSGDMPTASVRELPPIVTNLAAPDGAWVRLQAAIVYDGVDSKQLDVLSGKVVDDTMAYIKTLTVTQLQGAAGLQHLREDLNERVALRSDGHVKEMMIEMLVIE